MTAASSGVQAMTFGELLERSASRACTIDGDALAAETLSRSLTGVSLDSRDARGGYLYVAIGGASTHGLAYVDTLIAQGVAVVVLSDDDTTLSDYADALDRLSSAGVAVAMIQGLRDAASRLAASFYDHPSRHLRIVAVTGTDGKTSVCRCIASASASLGEPCGYIGTLGWGVDEQLRATRLTTPDVVSMQRMLAELRAAGATTVALEASSHGIVEGRLAGLHIDVAVLTNLGRDHLDYHPDLEAYAGAKARLFHWPELGVAVVNGNDPLGQRISRETDRSVRCVRFAGHGDQPVDDNDIVAESVQANAAGLSFTLCDAAGDAYAITSPLIGAFNVDNLLACYATLCALGHAANDVATSLSDINPVPGRMERFGEPGQPTVIVDFAHTPQALVAAIEAARHHCEGALWVVFGCGGDRDRGKRAPMGEAALTADHVIVTDDNPRTEHSADILEDILAGMSRREHVDVIPDRASAIRHALQLASASDMVLIAGKGHEDYQIIGTRRIAYSDRDTVTSLLREAS